MNKETADSQSLISSPIGTLPPLLDSMSPNAQTIELPTTVSTKTEKQKKRKNKTSEIRELANQTDTSKNTSSDKQLDQQDTVLVPATKDETKIAIDALLSLGNDLSFGTEMDPTNNDLLQPIAPGNILPDPTLMVSKVNSDDTELLDEVVAPHTDNTLVVPSTKDTGDKQGKRKGKLVVQSFQLARNYKPKCRFSCVGCPQKFTTNRELNNHFRSLHPPLTCTDCKNYSQHQVPLKNTSTYTTNLCMSVRQAAKAFTLKVNYQCTKENIPQTKA